MAAVFMVSPVQLRISGLLLISMLLNGCISDSHKEIPIPEKWVNLYDTGWVESQGILFLNGTPFSGWKFATGEIGDTIYLGGYIEGLKEGVHQSKYPAGEVYEERQFIAGRQTGRGRQWHANGRLAFEAEYQQDQYEGLVQSWYENGEQHERFHYQYGREEGLQQRWDEQGNVLANYEVRNGRKYGLSGTKHCASPWEVDSLDLLDE